MYAEIFDGLRGYYAGFESRRDSAGWHAAMSMSMFCCLDVGAAIPIADYLIYGGHDLAGVLYENKLGVLLIGVAIAYAHVLFGKHTGRYKSLEPARSSRWKRYLFIRASITAALMLTAILIAVFT